ncbi:MAG TPA: pitrilysin family protein [Candidatus Humimicrobiaceae bacterium]|nr:pitrilysin family protein [Candidatus Humimicrobiaceae bacterium]
MFEKTTLRNGLRIITVPQETAQAVTVLVLVGTGSKYERKKINGISHFLEHMYFKGTDRRPKPVDVVEPLDKIGGIYNAFTSQEFTGYFAKVEASHFELALDWVSDIFLNSTLPEKEIEKEKKVIVEEINMIYDHPMAYIGFLWTKLLYGDQPAGWNVAGTKESISLLSRQKLADYRKKQYVASNTILCLSGSINQGKAIGLAKKYFSKIKKGKPEKKLKVMEIQKKPRCLVEERKIDQTHLYLGVRGFNVSHPQRHTQEILGTILGGSGMMSSRLFVEVREKLGLAYYISTDIEEDSDTGFLVTRAGVDNQRTEKAIEIILREYKKISAIKVPEKELKKAKDNVKGKLALSLETSDALASFYVGQELLEKEILTPEEIYKKIDKITQNDILKTAKDIFRPEKLNLALIGPFKDKTKFQRLLN